MFGISREYVNEIKKKYTEGTRIRLNYMDDPYCPVPSGTEGTVKFVDDIGQIHMYWDNGSNLALNLNYDSFSVI